MKLTAFAGLAAASLLISSCLVEGPEQTVCWGQSQADSDLLYIQWANAYCPREACFAEFQTVDIGATSNETLVATDSDFPGCSSCPGDPSRVSFVVTAPEYELILTFDSGLLVDGVTLDNLRAHLLRSRLEFVVPSNTDETLTATVYTDGSEVDITGYENGVLTLHFSDVSESAQGEIRESPPWICPRPEGFCTQVSCGYDRGTHDSDPIQVDVSLRAALELP